MNKSGTVVVDTQGVCVYVSEQALQILHIKRRQIIGQLFIDAVALQTIEDKPVEELKHPVMQALRSKTFTQVTPFFCKLTSSEDTTLAMNVLQIKKGRKLHSLLVQLRKAEREVNIGEMKSLFVSFAAHQLKTPSSIVKGFLELMIREGRKSYSADQWNFLISAFESNEHLITVSKTLLSLARLEGGLIAPHVRSFDPLSVLKTKIKSVDALLKIKRVEVALEHKGKGSIYSDDSFFLEIFEILFANAIKHSPNDTRIVVQCTVSRNGVEVHIIDNGPGISAAQKEKLFISAQDSAPDKNTHGLGLYMAKKYIALLGGKIGVQDGPGQNGSDFHFFLPNERPR